MEDITCRGLPASWLNGWLAAVGTTVLDSRVRLRWSAESPPAAILSADDGSDPIDAVVASWPDREMLQELPLAEHWRNAGQLKRKVPVEAFAARVRAARGHLHSWTLSSTLTDLLVDGGGEVAHAPFDPAGPGTIKWLHHRLMKVHEQVEPSAEHLADTFAGRATRVKDNGLGFDQTRLGSQSDATAKWVDPVVEVLAFFGLALLPVRGEGVDRRLGRAAGGHAIQRGWERSGQVHRFRWPAWTQALDCAGIDALLDIWQPERKSTWQRIGVRDAWQTIQFRPKRSADTTRAFGAERL